MPRPMPLPDLVSRVPDQPVSFQRLVNPSPLEIGLLNTLPGFDDDIYDIKLPKVTLDNLQKMYRKYRKLFDKFKMR